MRTQALDEFEGCDTPADHDRRFPAPRMFQDVLCILHVIEFEHAFQIRRREPPTATPVLLLRSITCRRKDFSDHRIAGNVFRAGWLSRGSSRSGNSSAGNLPGCGEIMPCHAVHRSDNKPARATNKIHAGHRRPGQPHRRCPPSGSHSIAAIPATPEPMIDVSHPAPFLKRSVCSKRSTPQQTARHTFATCNTLTVSDRVALPGMRTHIDADGTVVRANTTLHTTRRIRDSRVLRQELCVCLHLF